MLDCNPFNKKPFKWDKYNIFVIKFFGASKVFELHVPILVVYVFLSYVYTCVDTLYNTLFTN